MKNRGVKSYLKLLASAFVVLAAMVSCNKRQILSDDELAQIFHDAFLANAYAAHTQIKLDSLKLYEPIFNRYGYSTEDVQYTIGSFSTRKSARLSDVVEEAIRMLEQEGKVLDTEVGVLDTISNIAVRRTSTIVYSDSLVRFESFRDTAALRITLDNPKKGQYYIDFDYRIDSLDTSPKGYKTSRWVDNLVPKRSVKSAKKVTKKDIATDTLKVDQPDSIIYETRRVNSNSTTLSRGRVASYNSSIKVDDNTERLVVVLLQPVQLKGKPSVTIKNLRIKRVLSADKAQDSLYRELIPIRIFSDELLLRR